MSRVGPVQIDLDHGEHGDPLRLVLETLADERLGLLAVLEELDDIADPGAQTLSIGDADRSASVVSPRKQAHHVGSRPLQIFERMLDD